MSSLNDITDAGSTAGAAMTRAGASSSNLHGALFIGLAAILALLPLTEPGPFVLVVLAEIFCFALFASAFNLMLGYGGLLSFGHAMFFGFSSYVAAYTAKNGLDVIRVWLPWAGTSDIPLGIPPLPPELAVLLGTAVAALLGLVTGAVATVLAGYFGTSNFTFSVDSRVTNTTHTFTSTDQLVSEVEDARIYAGFHYHHSVVQGKILGRSVAHHLMHHYFRRIDD